MASLTDPQDSALARLFARKRASGEAVWFSLPGGAVLYGPGEPADQLYLVQTGRLGAFRREEGQERHFVGIVRPGEPVGEMALIAGLPHSATVAALRDSEICALPRDLFFDEAERDPTVMTELARLMILRTRQAATQTSVGAPSVFGFMAVEEGPSIRALVEDLEAAVEALGYAATVIGAEAQHAPTEWFSNVERDHDFVLFVAEQGETGWQHVVGRQVDRLFRVGHGANAPPAMLDLSTAEPLQAQHLIDLILLHPADHPQPSGSDAWLDATEAARLFHMREGNAADIARIARVLTGQSVGLVLSGGGARAYAHIGAIRALHKAGVPIDFVGGVSMGAIIAAGVAMGWDDEEMETRIRKAFVTTSPLDDIAFPLVSMITGEKVRMRLDEHFGDTQISDLWLPFFCLSSNLTSGVYHLHKRGLLRQALRASISLPGILPPVTDNNSVLVDGAVMKNFPADIMRSMHLGPVVGIDVTYGRSLDADDVKAPKSLWRWFWSGEWRKGPPIVALLMRSATVSTGREAAMSRQATDVLVMPKVEMIDIRDWKAYAPAVEAGQKATQDVLDQLDRPVTDLRRRLSLAEEAMAPAPGVAAVMTAGPR
ncbi:MAG: cyclic nucleotide-binding protein [Caulobacter sp.]|nr:cyclic nucleotide-binding protein [Caulobacter sp.]